MTSRSFIAQGKGMVIMQELGLDAIEQAVGFALPTAYREVATKSPFRPIGRDAIYWFFDDPQTVISETLAPLSDGEYDQTQWQNGFLAIGQSAAGDLYLLDTRSCDLPVLSLSHETHLLATEWPTFDAYVQEWIRVPDQIEHEIGERYAKSQVEQKARMRRGLKVVAAIIAFCLAFPFMLWVVIYLIKGKVK
jgi:hypothetical protein